MSSWSFIRNALQRQPRQFVEAQRAIWTGAQWREQRADFRLHHYQVAAANGVAYDTAQ